MSFVELEISSWLKERDKFDLLIDARSPSEFNYSNIIKSQNFFALNDLEHEEVGTIYKDNRSNAKVLGARYICLNLNAHLDEIYKKHRVGSLVGIYCARGGMRSMALAQVLSMIGYRIVRLEGGYKAYRNYVLDSFSKPLDMKFITLFGNTGCGKTRLIRLLENSLNLEKMAKNLGSVFGHIAGIQPSQKAFENDLFEKLLSFEDSKICFIEGESRRIGDLTLPASIYTAMREGIRVWVNASLEKRVECILEDYKGIGSEFFYSCMDKIRPFISLDDRLSAINAFEANDMGKVAEILLVKYYDKVYKKPQNVDFVINSDNLDKAKSELLEIYNLNLEKGKI